MKTMEDYDNLKRKRDSFKVQLMSVRGNPGVYALYSCVVREANHKLTLFEKANLEFFV